MNKEHERLERSKALREMKESLINRDKAKRNAQILERAKFMSDYYAIKDMQKRKELMRNNLMEAARDDAFKTIIKTIYISALEANTLTDDNLLIAENMVDTWVKERGGASKIMDGIENESYILSRIAQIVEEEAEASTEEIMDKSDDEELKDQAVDKAKELIASGDKEQVKDFLNQVVDDMADKAADNSDEDSDAVADNDDSADGVESKGDGSQVDDDGKEETTADPQNDDAEDDSEEDSPEDDDDVDSLLSKVDDASDDDDDDSDDDSDDDDEDDDDEESEDEEEEKEEEKSEEEDSDDGKEEEKTEDEESSESEVSQDNSDTAVEDDEAPADSSADEGEGDEASEESPSENDTTEDGDENDNEVEITQDSEEDSDESEAEDGDEDASDDSESGSDAEDADELLKKVDDSEEDSDEESEEEDSPEDASDDEESDEGEEELKDEDLDDESPDDDDTDTDITVDGGVDNDGKVFDELDKEEDVQKAVEIIRSRVADAEETFIRNNAEDKKKIDELLNKISNNVKTVESLKDKDPDKAEVAKESAMMAKRQMNNIGNDEVPVFDRMVANITEGIVKNDDIRDDYLNESGSLDVNKAVETAKVMYTFLETINTLRLENVNDGYIAKVLNSIE